MVRNLNNITPIINFEGTNLNYKIVTINSNVTVWLKNIINQDVFDSNLTSSLPIQTVSNQQFTITANQKGYHRIRFNLSYKDKRNTAIKYSRDLLLIVIESIT